MEQHMMNVKVRDIYRGYRDTEEFGTTGYSGKLNMRPAYQREFCYKDRQRDAVIDTLMGNCSLGLMFWADNGDGTYELMDGQQRTLSICKYIHGDFAYEGRYFHNLTMDEQEDLLDKELSVCVCKGTEREKLEWFRRINIAGAVLTDQELRNAAYTGPWLTDAKKYFSKTACAAYRLAEPYMKGSPIRQDYLETVLDWISGGHIEEYMAEHQHDADAKELWDYFRSVIDWVQTVFPTYRKEMKGVAWGRLFNEHHDVTESLDGEAERLLGDPEVERPSGVFEYVLTRDESLLHLRTFNATQKRDAYERQGHRCPHCMAEGVDREYDISEMEGDHIRPWREGGATTVDNLQMLCRHHNRLKGAR